MSVVRVRVLRRVVVEGLCRPRHLHRGGKGEMEEEDSRYRNEEAEDERSALGELKEARVRKKKRKKKRERTSTDDPGGFRHGCVNME